MRDRIVIGTRAGDLAVAQAELVRSHIRRTQPSLETKLLPLTTSGDLILDAPLESAGGKGLFVRELDTALREKRSDLSVHSLKDVPTELPKDLPLVAYSKREAAEDALVLPLGVDEPDLSKPIGCSSNRRMLQFQALFPDAKFRLIRGNVKTRLEKLDSGDYAATILAAAGLIRLGLENRISRLFTTDEMVPAAGQGIIAVQGRVGEDYGFLAGFSDREAELCARAERAFVFALGGNCSTPVGAYAEIKGGTLKLKAFYFDEKKNRSYRDDISGSIDRPEELGKELAKRFKED